MLDADRWPAGRGQPLRWRRRGPAVAILVLAAVLLPALSGPAAAQDGPALQGTLETDEGEPVEGAEILVEDEDGQEVGTGTSDADGSWLVELPETGVYAVTLDQATLPEDVQLRDDERATLSINVRSERRPVTVVYALGEDPGTAEVLLRQLSRVPQLALNGLRIGMIIAMAAIGLSLVFGTTRLINFAHGDMVTFGAIVAWFLNVAGVHIIPAAAIAVTAGAALGYGIERGLWRPLRDRKTGLVQMLVISIGMALLLRHVLLIVFGGRSRPYLDYTIQGRWSFGPFAITPRDLTILVLSVLVLVGVGLLLQKTRLGKAMRAVSDNRDLAESSGINVRAVILMVWVMGGGLAALGGVFFGLVQNVNYLMGFELLLYMFAGVILGGIGTAFGAMVGSILVGLVTEMSPLVLSPELKLVWALLVLIIVLLVRPQGILGVRERVG